jgi:uncharacterized protein YidB (DUF937 family)
LKELSMSNDFIGQILGRVLGNEASGPQGLPGGLGGLGGLAGGLGSVLGNVLGGRGGQEEGGTGAAPSSGGQGALLTLLLPLAMQWIQRSGGVGAVLDRFKQQGYGQQSASWVSTGDNKPLDTQAVHDVVGSEELSRLAQQAGVPQEQVASGLAEILPQVVNHLTPSGDVPQDADDVLGSGVAALQRMLGGQPPTGS